MKEKNQRPFAVMRKAFLMERRKMGGIGSDRKPKQKKETIVDFKPAEEKVKQEGRLYSVPMHVKKIKTSGGCRFQG